MKYFKVTAKCGHVGGPKKYILIDFYTTAESGKEAAAQIRHAPRVKHDHKDAIRAVSEISLVDYIRGQREFNADPYNRCTNHQEQSLYWRSIEPRVMTEAVEESYRRLQHSTTPLNLKRSLRYGYSDSPSYSRQYLTRLCA